MPQVTKYWARTLSPNVPALRDESKPRAWPEFSIACVVAMGRCTLGKEDQLPVGPRSSGDSEAREAASRREQQPPLGQTAGFSTAGSMSFLFPQGHVPPKSQASSS